MKIRSGLLAQLEKCSLSAQLSADHDETSASSERSRLIHTEVTRSWAVQDQGALPEAEAALTWLRGEPSKVKTVGLGIDLVDPETGEVLVTGKPGAMLANPNLAVSWASFAGQIENWSTIGRAVSKATTARQSSPRQARSETSSWTT